MIFLDRLGNTKLCLLLLAFIFMFTSNWRTTAKVGKSSIHGLVEQWGLHENEPKSEHKQSSGKELKCLRWLHSMALIGLCVTKKKRGYDWKRKVKLFDIQVEKLQAECIFQFLDFVFNYKPIKCQSDQTKPLNWVCNSRALNSVFISWYGVTWCFSSLFSFSIYKANNFHSTENRNTIPSQNSAME